jgi:hypothetical protein
VNGMGDRVLVSQAVQGATAKRLKWSFAARVTARVTGLGLPAVPAPAARQRAAARIGGVRNEGAEEFRDVNGGVTESEERFPHAGQPPRSGPR